MIKDLYIDFLLSKKPLYLHYGVYGVYTRPAENFQVSKAQTPFNFLGQKESIPQILGHLAVI